MTYEKNLKVKNLKVKQTKKVPTEVLTASTVLYGEDSGKTFTFGLLTAALNVTLPSAEVGRRVKFIYNNVGAGFPALAFNLTLTVKNTGEAILGNAMTINDTNDDRDVVLNKNGTTNNSIAFDAVTNANILPGSYVELTSFVKGIWTLSAIGVTDAGAATGVFA